MTIGELNRKNLSGLFKAMASSPTRDCIACEDGTPAIKGSEFCHFHTMEQYRNEEAALHPEDQGPDADALYELDRDLRRDE